MKLPSWVNTILFQRAAGRVQPFNLALFKESIEIIKKGNKATKENEIRKLLSIEGLKVHHIDKTTKRRVKAECDRFEYPHEYHTAKKLTAVDYDVILVPPGYFKRHEKGFDVFILRDHILLEAELKCITSINKDTIGNRIKAGSEQSNRIVVDITSTIPRNALIEGLKTGCERNDSLCEILLFYNSRFYCLPKTLILSKRIFKTIN